VTAVPDFPALFAPRSVAIIGISRRPGSVGHRALAALRRHGFTGEIYGVHPEADEIEGVAAAPSLASLPTVPELVVALRPPRDTIEAVAAAGELGVGWVLAGGGGFEADPELVARLSETAAAGGVSVIGPNTEGLWDLSSPLVASFGSVALNDDLFDGPASVVSQSGGVGAAMARQLLASGLGCRTFVSTGNELNVSVTDVFAHLVQRGDQRLFTLFLEAVDDLARLRDLVAAAVAGGAVVAVLKVGRSAAGAEAAASHSGRMAGNDALYRSALVDAGAVMLDSIAELGTLARALRVGRPVPGAGLGVVAVSGGTRAMVVDAIDEAAHLRLARFADATVGRVEEILPDYAVATNPIDVTGAVLGDHTLLDRCVRAVVEDGDVGGVLVQLGNTQLSGLPEWVADGRADFGGVPVWVSGLHHPELERLARTVPSLSEPTAAVRALDSLAGTGHEDGERTIGAQRVAPAERPANFLEAADLLREAGIETPTSIVAGEGLESLPSVPAIVKTGNLAVHHKADAGGIIGGVGTPAAAAEAATTIRHRLGELAEPVLIQELVEHEQEILLAVHRSGNDRFLVLGGGGSNVEAGGDIALCLLPASPAAVRRALEATQAGRSLAEAERAAVCASAAGLARLHAALGCLELEINPLVIVAGRPVALDLLIGYRILDL
jgi:acyl-CoA synthetase (NDP forming)